MDKPRHPQVIRPWKTQETQKCPTNKLTTWRPKEPEPKSTEERYV